jgi:hypothetical protein
MHKKGNYSADKARSASDRPATRDAQHPESGVLNSYKKLSAGFG